MNDSPEARGLLPHLEIMTAWAIGTQYTDDKRPTVPRSFRNRKPVHPVDTEIGMRILSDSSVAVLCWPCQVKTAGLTGGKEVEISHDVPEVGACLH